MASSTKVTGRCPICGQDDIEVVRQSLYEHGSGGADHTNEEPSGPFVLLRHVRGPKSGNGRGEDCDGEGTPADPQPE